MTTKAATGKKRRRLTKAQRTAILKALADPRRFELLELVARTTCAMNCSEVRASIPISAATLSHHVKELETAGLIRIEREGKFHHLLLQPEGLQAVAEALTDLAASLDPCPRSITAD